MNLPEIVAEFEQPLSDVRKRFRMSPVFAIARMELRLTANCRPLGSHGVSPVTGEVEFTIESCRKAPVFF